MVAKIITNHKFSKEAIVTQKDNGEIVVDLTKIKAARLRKKPTGYEHIIQAPRPALVRNPLPYARMHRLRLKAFL